MRLTFFFFCLLLISCDNPYPEYSALGHGVYAKLLEFGEDDQTSICSSFQSQVSYKLGLQREADQGYDYWNDYTFQNVQLEALAQGKLGEKLCSLKSGEKYRFIFPYESIRESYMNDYESDGLKIADTTVMFMEIEVLDLMSEEEYNAMLEKKFQEGIIEENRYLKEYLSKEGLIENCQFQEDIYWMRTDTTQGRKAERGMEIAIDYVGMTLDGVEFDNTAVNESTLYFQLGKPGQVIRGLELALLHMREGETCRVFIPSHKAFGRSGSSTGVVKVNTPIYYDLTLKEIFESDS